MKLLAYIGFVGLLVMNGLFSTTQVFTFLLDQERIAKEECVEREVEGNCCQGRCVLTKKLKAVTKPSNEEQEPTLIVLHFCPDVLVTEFLLSQNHSDSLTSSKPGCLPSKYTSIKLGNIDPPPRSYA